MKIDNFVRATVENFNEECADSWGNSNSLMLQGLGIIGRKSSECARILNNLMPRISYDKKYAGIAAFYMLEEGEAEVTGRIKDLMAKLKASFDEETDEMALAFYTKYETKLGGKEHYQDVMNRYNKAAANANKNSAYFMTAVIEGIESVDQAIYEYYAGLKTLFKEAMADVLNAPQLDINDKALASYAILKACRLKVVLAEKYEAIALKWYEDVLENVESKDINRGAVVMLMAEKNYAGRNDGWN